MNFAIIAAGEGSRLVQEGISRPKPLVELNGVPMIKRLMDIMIKCHAEFLSVIVNEQMVEVREYLETLSLPVPFHLVVKSTPSSMHSFREVSRTFPTQGRFILTTVDTIFPEAEFKKYITAFENAENIDGCMAVTPFIDDEKPLYVEVDSDGMITAFRDEAWQGVRYVSGGIYGLSGRALDILDECMANGVSRMRNYQRALIAGGLRLKAYSFDKIIDVDHAGDIAVAESFIRNNP